MTTRPRCPYRSALSARGHGVNADEKARDSAVSRGSWRARRTFFAARPKHVELVTVQFHATPSVSDQGERITVASAPDDCRRPQARPNVDRRKVEEHCWPDQQTVHDAVEYLARRRKEALERRRPIDQWARCSRAPSRRDSQPKTARVSPPCWRWRKTASF